MEHGVAVDKCLRELTARLMVGVERANILIGFEWIKGEFGWLFKG